MTLEVLSESVTRWAEEKEDPLLEGLVSATAEYLYENMERYRLDWIDEDRKGDFFLWLYPKFPRILGKFDPLRASFGTYLYWNVRMAWKSFIRSRFSEEARRKVIEQEARETCLAMEGENRYGVRLNEDSSDRLVRGLERREKGDDAVSSLSEKRREIHSRTVLLLACKACSLLEERHFTHIARETGLSQDQLRTLVERVRTESAVREETVKRTGERINVLYHRLRRCRYEMRYLEPDSSRYRELQRECATCEKRLQTARATARRHIRSPSNRLLSRILGIPRGTVDSTLASSRLSGYADPS